MLKSYIANYKNIYNLLVKEDEIKTSLVKLLNTIPKTLTINLSPLKRFHNAYAL